MITSPSKDKVYQIRYLTIVFRNIKLISNKKKSIKKEYLQVTSSPKYSCNLQIDSCTLSPSNILFVFSDSDVFRYWYLFK